MHRNSSSIEVVPGLVHPRWSRMRYRSSYAEQWHGMPFHVFEAQLRSKAPRHTNKGGAHPSGRGWREVSFQSSCDFAIGCMQPGYAAQSHPGETLRAAFSMGVGDGLLLLQYWVVCGTGWTCTTCRTFERGGTNASVA